MGRPRAGDAIKQKQNLNICCSRKVNEHSLVETGTGCTYLVRPRAFMIPLYVDVLTW